MTVQETRLRALAGAVVFAGAMGAVLLGYANRGGEPLTQGDCAGARTVAGALELEQKNPSGDCPTMYLGKVTLTRIEGSTFNMVDFGSTGYNPARLQVDVAPSIHLNTKSGQPSCDGVRLDHDARTDRYNLDACGSKAIPVSTPTPRPTSTARPSAMEPAYYDVKQITQMGFEADHQGQVLPINGVTLVPGDALNAWRVNGTQIYLKSGTLPNPHDSGSPARVTCMAGSTIQEPRVAGYDPTVVHCIR